MTVFLLEPHYDDAVLFASYTLLREKPLVITVCGDAQVQEPAVSRGDRWAETMAALPILGANEWSWHGWEISDVNPDWGKVDDYIRTLNDWPDFTRVYVPLPEDGGHEHHNAVGNIARIAFGDKVQFYATYRRGERRTRTETEVPFEPHWPALKLRAMACYESQITLENTRPWFDDWQREWYG